MTSDYTPTATQWKYIPVPKGMEDSPIIKSLHAPIRMPKVEEEIIHCSPNEIVPEDVQNRLMAIDDTMTRAYFEIGDIANELIQYAPQVTKDQHKVITEQDVFNAVGVFCHRSGRTVRYYAETAEFYAQDVRVEFDILPFSHFVVARSFGLRWRDVLEFARDNPTMSEERLRQQFVMTLNVEKEQRKAFESQYAEIADVVLSKIDSEPPKNLDTEGVRKVRSTNSLLLSRLSSLVDILQKLHGDVSDVERKARIAGVLAEVRDIIFDIQKDLGVYDIM